jgi:hypothetical protein
MLFVINPHKFMWHWKMSNTELVYSLLGFDTPTSGPTLTFPASTYYTQHHYRTSLLFIQHHQLPTTPITFTNLQLYNSPAISPQMLTLKQHVIRIPPYQPVATTQITLFSAYEPYYTQRMLQSPIKSLRLVFSTTLTAPRPTHHWPQLICLPTHLTSAIWHTSPNVQFTGNSTCQTWFSTFSCPPTTITPHSTHSYFSHLPSTLPPKAHIQKCVEEVLP